MKLTLHGYFRSGTSYRTRIALNLKGLDYQYCPVNLLKDEQKQSLFTTLNPQGLVPALEVDGSVLIQSPAIIEWLDERFPQPPLLPTNAEQRARVRALAAVIGCDIHPINNKRILDYLRTQFSADQSTVNAWSGTWIDAGFKALEALLKDDHDRTTFCFGDAPTIADVYLIPQVDSARRFGVDLEPYPLIREIDEHCRQLDAFRNAAPMAQPDAPQA